MVDKSNDMRRWIMLLSNFNGSQLSKSLSTSIEIHFKYYWAHDRLINLSQEDEYLKALPRSIKRQLMTDHLFKDLFIKFKTFFHTKEFKDSKVLYDISFGFMPRFFDDKSDDKYIYYEEDEVPEMYFIIGGTVGIGYSLLTRGGPDVKQ